MPWFQEQEIAGDCNAVDSPSTPPRAAPCPYRDVRLQEASSPWATWSGTSTPEKLTFDPHRLRHLSPWKQVQTSPQKVELCVDYRRGACFRGDGCRYYHADDDKGWAPSRGSKPMQSDNRKLAVMKRERDRLDKEIRRLEEAKVSVQPPPPPGPPPGWNSPRDASCRGEDERSVVEPKEMPSDIDPHSVGARLTDSLSPSTNSEASPWAALADDREIYRRPRQYDLADDREICRRPRQYDLADDREIYRRPREYDGYTSSFHLDRGHPRRPCRRGPVTVVILGITGQGLSFEEVQVWLQEKPGFLLLKVSERKDCILATFETSEHAAQCKRDATAWRWTAELSEKTLVGAAEARHHLHDGDRGILKEERCTGRVACWMGRHGWIDPDEQIDHENLHLHRGQVFLSKKDALDFYVVEGMRVSYVLYNDGRGLGAQDVQMI